MVLQDRLAIWKKSSTARNQSSRRNRRPSAPNRAHVAAAESLEPRAMLVADLQNIVPGQQVAYVDTYQYGNHFISLPLAFTAAQGNGISVSHATIGTNPLRVTLSVDCGTLTLARPNTPNGGIVYRAGDGRDDSLIVFEGGLGDVNTALSWVTYTPPATDVFQWNPAAGGNGHWYQFVRVARSWDQAKADAEARGGYLATLTSAQEDAFVNSLLHNPTDLPWFGGYQDRKAGDYSEPFGGWRWITGEPWAYTNWNRGEPNNGLGGPAEDYLHGNSSGTAKWNDGISPSLLPYVIEFHSDPRPTPVASATLTITTDDQGYSGARQADTDQVPIRLRPLAPFAPPPPYSTNPATFDPGFGQQGVVVRDGTIGGIDYVTDMRVLPDGRFITVGALNNRVGIRRFNADGTLDTSFANNGTGTQVDLGAGVIPIEMQIDNGGRILVLTTRTLLRFTPDGLLDASFGTAGKVTFTRDCLSLRVSPDNSYLVAAESRLLVYDDSGSQRMTHATNWWTAKAEITQDATVMVFQPNGNTLYTNTYKPLNAGYQLQQSFQFALGPTFTIASSCVLPDGRILLVGSSDNDLFACRLLGDGRLDMTFGLNGVSRIPVGNGADAGWRAAVTPDGKLLITGYAANNGTSTSTSMSVVRLSYDGLLDPSFGGGGVRLINVPNSSAGYTVATLPDGKILLAGRNNDDTLLVRLLGDGLNPNGPSNVTLTGTTVPETAAVGALVGALSATDTTGGDTFTYSLVAGPGAEDNSGFLISGDQLTLNTALDYETRNRLSVRVRATDGTGAWFERVFAIDVGNVNEAPGLPSLSGTSIVENSPLQSIVGTLSATDPDAGESLTFALVAGSGDGDNAAFAVSGNRLRTAVALDADTKGSFSVRVRVTDRGGLSTERAFTIIVTNVNEAPQSISLSNATVLETIDTSTAVGTLTTIDADSSDTFTYTLVSGSGDADNASFAIIGTELRPAVTLDFETQTSYRIRVRSTDSGQLFTEASFTITVSDVSPEPPKAILLSATTVAENEPAQTVVGTLTSLDDDAGDTFTYQLVAGSGDADNASFEIVADRVRTAAQLDREAKPVRSVRIRSTDSLGLVREQMFQITVSNVNEQPTGIALSSTNVLDGSAIETVVGRLSATDPDSGDSFTYALVAGTGDTDNAAFKIVGSQLRVAAVPRFAAGSTRTVRLQATDAGGLTTERAFTIIVDDQNDAPTDILLQPNTIAENQPAGSAVGTLTAVDPDMGGRYSFALVGGAGAGDNPLFTIVSGQVRSKAPFNYEARSQYSVRIRVTDQGGLFMEKVLPVLVTDANDAPTNITLSAATVAENSATGTLVGTLAATDVDAGDSFTYSLVAGNGAADNAGFVIQGAEVRTAKSFDFEAQRALSVRVRATDAAGAAFEKTLKISVTNVNEAPTDIRIYGGTVAENLPAGTVAASLAAVDPDAASQFTYGLVDGSGSDGNPYFTIRGNQVLTGAPLDFEARPDYSIRVRATDTSGLATEKAITIRVTDVNEAPTGLALSKATVAENLPAGTAVGTFTASDPDANNTFTYLLASGAGGNGNRFFQIVGNELRTAAPFDREAKSSYSVRVQTVDQSGASAFGVFIIRIDDVNEAPTAITMTGGTIAENSAPGTVAARFGTTDPDRSDTFTYSLVSGAGDSGNSMFAILGNQLVAAGDLDFETARQWTVRLRSTDSGGQSVESRFTIAVTDVNERPRTLSLVQQALSGQIAAGAVVGRLSATDADAGERLSYSLVSGTGDTGNALFSLNGNSLRTKTAMTFEPGRSYSVRIRVTDKGGLTLEQVFEIVPLSASVALRAGA